VLPNGHEQASGQSPARPAYSTSDFVCYVASGEIPGREKILMHIWHKATRILTLGRNSWRWRPVLP
jgi:hypothetical protein